MNNAREQGLDGGERETFQSERAAWRLGSFLLASGHDTGAECESVLLLRGADLLGACASSSLGQKTDSCGLRGTGLLGASPSSSGAGDVVWSSSSCPADSLRGALPRRASRVTGQASAGR